MVLIRHTAMRQPCVQLSVFQINDNPFDNIMKLLYASPFKEVSTSFNYHCCSTWQHASWRHDGNFQVGVIDEQLHDHELMTGHKMCLLNTHFLLWWKVEINTKEKKFFPTF